MKLAEIAFCTDQVPTMPDFYRCLQRMMQQGISVELPPQESYRGRPAYLRDPDGHQIEIRQKGS